MLETCIYLFSFIARIHADEVKLKSLFASYKRIAPKSNSRNMKKTLIPPNQEKVKLREWFPYTGLIPKVISLKLFLGMYRVSGVVWVFVED